MSTPSPLARPALVLIANDHEWTARSLDSILGPKGYAVLRAFTGRQCIDLARTTHPDAIIVDLHLPDMDGLDVLRQLRAHPLGEVTPCIGVTSSGISRSERLAAMEAGAWVVCTQPLDGDVLLRQLATYVRARRVMENLADASLLDADSGLYNARGLARRARELGAEAQRRREPLACVAFSPEMASGAMERPASESIDGLVRRLIDIVTRSGRLSDVVGRLGQTEFAVLLPATEAQGAIRLIERLQRALAQETEGAEAADRPAPQLRAGYAAEPDFAQSSVDAVELVLRATAAMRHTRSSQSREMITAFHDVPAAFPH